MFERNMVTDDLRMLLAYNRKEFGLFWGSARTGSADPLTVLGFPPSVPVSDYSVFCNILYFSQEFLYQNKKALP